MVVIGIDACCIILVFELVDDGDDSDDGDDGDTDLKAIFVIFVKYE